VANIQATLHAAFGHVELLPFITMSYAIAQGCGMPLVRKLSDFTDLRFMMVFGAFLFAAGAIICGSAQSMNAIIIGRVVKGLGGSFLLQM
jgi:MFS family permease